MIVNWRFSCCRQTLFFWSWGDNQARQPAREIPQRTTTMYEHEKAWQRHIRLTSGQSLLDNLIATKRQAMAKGPEHSRAARLSGCGAPSTAVRRGRPLPSRAMDKPRLLPLDRIIIKPRSHNYVLWLPPLLLHNLRQCRRGSDGGGGGGAEEPHCRRTWLIKKKYRITAN